MVKSYIHFDRFDSDLASHESANPQKIINFKAFHLKPCNFYRTKMGTVWSNFYFLLNGYLTISNFWGLKIYTDLAGKLAFKF